jgi:hypothetical protein
MRQKHPAWQSHAVIAVERPTACDCFVASLLNLFGHRQAGQPALRLAGLPAYGQKDRNGPLRSRVTEKL